MLHAVLSIVHQISKNSYNFQTKQTLTNLIEFLIYVY